MKKRNNRCRDCGLILENCICSERQKRMRAFVDTAKEYGFTENQAIFLLKEFDDLKSI